MWMYDNTCTSKTIQQASLSDQSTAHTVKLV